MVMVLFSAVAAAEPPRGATDPALELHRVERPHGGSVYAVFDGILHSAGLGISSGKLAVYTRGKDGRTEQLAVNVGTARLTPLFDVNFRGATGVLRFAF
jgi:hypothetical protein